MALESTYLKCPLIFILDMSQQCVLTAQKSQLNAGLHLKQCGQQVKEVILPLCSAFMRLQLECCTQLWSPQTGTWTY